MSSSSGNPSDGSDESSSFLTAYGSHIAAVVVGVVVTLAFVNTLSSNNNNKTATPNIANGTGTGGAGGKKKKRNKKKGKGSGSNGGEDSTSPPISSTTNGTKATAKSNGTTSNKSAVKIVEPTKVQEEKSTTTAAAPSTGGGKKKNKKKNGNATKPNGTAASTNGTTSSKQQDSNNIKQNGSATTTTTTAAPAAAAVDFYEYDPRQAKEAEEVWETIPNNKSKNKNKKKASKPATAAAATSNGSSATQTSTKVSEVVTIDATKVGAIIGPKGATLLAISAATGCKLDVNAPPKDAKPNPRSTKPLQATVVISEGTSEGVAKAKQAVLELAASGYATLLQAETFGEQSLTVHPRVLSEIVGPGGKTIQAIQTALNVKITIPKTDWTPKTPQIGNIQPSCRVGIAGDDRAKVKEAKQVIQQVLKYHHHEITHPGMIHQEIYVPQEFFHCVIGPRGSEIKHIRGNYKVEIYMPTADGPTDNVIVVGPKPNVEKAIRYIELLMERDSEQRAQKYSDEYYG